MESAALGHPVRCAECRILYIAGQPLSPGAPFPQLTLWSIVLEGQRERSKVNNIYMILIVALAILSLVLKWIGCTHGAGR